MGVTVVALVLAMYAHAPTLKAEVVVSVRWLSRSRHSLLDLRDREETSQAKTS